MFRGALEAQVQFGGAAAKSQHRQIELDLQGTQEAKKKSHFLVALIRFFPGFG
jgi:hypothetical protein